MKNPDIPALTSLRFFAAATIVLEHSIPYFHLGTAFASKYVLIQGVTFFFVLSGFILTYSHKGDSGVAGSFLFIYSRISRVWPAHIVAMLICYALLVGVLGIAYEPTIGQTLLSATLTQAWSPLPSDFFAFNGVAWTLSVEMFFYVLFPVLIINFKNTWHIKLTLALTLAIGAILIAINTGAKPFDGTDVVSIASWVYICPPAHLVEFVLGMVAAQAWTTYGHLIRGKEWATVAELVGVALILYGSAKVPALAWHIEALGYISAPTRSWLTVSGAAPFYAAALFLLSSRKGNVSTALSYWPLVWLGKISFSMYLVHQILERVLQLHPEWLGSTPMLVQFAAYWVATIALSWALWRFVEIPGRAAMLLVLKKKTPPVQEARESAGHTVI